MDLRPTDIDSLRATMVAAADAGTPVAVRGGGTRSDPPADPDLAVLHTIDVAGIVDHTPAELTVTVLAGTETHTLGEHLAGVGQWWPQAEVRAGSTVGGVIATGASGRRRLRYGALRDSLLEVVLVTGDGRLVKGGGRTVKSVAGYDIPRLASGSRGRLGVIVQATIKLTPVPPASGVFVMHGSVAERRAAARTLLREIWRPASLVLSPGRLAVELVGPQADVVPPPGFAEEESPPEPHGNAIVAVGVPPAQVGAFADHVESRGLVYEAEVGTGACRVAVEDAEQLATVDAWARAVGGHATVLAGPPALTATPPTRQHAVIAIEDRLRAAFDPRGILRPSPRPEAVR